MILYFYLKTIINLFGCIRSQLGHVDLLLWCRDSLVVVCGLSCPTACGILVPGPGIEAMSPALQGGFLSTGSAGKSLHRLF